KRDLLPSAGAPDRQRDTFGGRAVTIVRDGDKLFVNDENLLGQVVAKSLTGPKGTFSDLYDFKGLSRFEKSETYWHRDCFSVRRKSVAREFREAADVGGGHGGRRKALQQPE